jgi:hypothetical protein
MPDDAAYIMPMAVFLAFTWAGGQWPALFAVGYILKTALVGLFLILLRGHFTPIRWHYAWLGAIVGIVGVVQWVGMEKLLLHFWPNYPRLGQDVFDPLKQIHAGARLWTFLAVRLIGPALVVPFMEELFWRDFLWRSILDPNDFKLADVGEWDFKAVAIVTLLFASVHFQWLTALVWGTMIAWLLVRTRSLGACIIAHGVTNLLLGLYVLHTHDWQFW